MVYCVGAVIHIKINNTIGILESLVFTSYRASHVIRYVLRSIYCFAKYNLSGKENSTFFIKGSLERSVNRTVNSRRVWPECGHSFSAAAVKRAGIWAGYVPKFARF